MQTIDHQAPISPSQRVHRVSNRLGIVLAAPFMIAVVWHLSWIGINKHYLNGLQPWETDPVVHSATTNDVNGPWNQYRSPTEYQVAVAKSDIEASTFLAGVLVMAGIGVYVLVRALGWVVAGAMRS